MWVGSRLRWVLTTWKFELGGALGLRGIAILSRTDLAAKVRTMVCSSDKLTIPTFVWLLLSVGLSSPPFSAAEEDKAGESPQWISSVELRRFQAQSRLTVQWSGQTLRGALQGLAERAAAPKRLAFFLDRRVDPEQIFNLSVEASRWDELLERVGRSNGSAVQQIDTVFYLGPPRSVKKLAALLHRQRQMMRKLPRQRQRALLRREPTNWNELTEPRGLVKKLAEEGGMQVEGLERIPHDLWPAVELPPLTLSDRLTLVLFGFDLTYRTNATGTKLEVVPMDETLREQ